MKIIINFLVAFSCISALAQNTLSGTITDLQKEKLFGVEIYATDIHKGTITDENGNYTLKNLPNGTVKISFSYLGYQTVHANIQFDSKDKHFNLNLIESVFTIDEVIISTPFNKLQSENVMKVERLSAAALRKTGSPTLIEGLATISGVSQISTGASIGKPVIRGLSGNRVLVYAQGVRLENQQFGDEHGLGLNDSGIESIEVIKGPASLLYGSDALGGVIYINPEKFALTNTTDFNFNQRYFSNTLGSNSSFGFKSSSEAWKILARATINSHSDYKIPTNERVSNTRFKESDFKFGLGFNANNYSNEFRYNYNHSLLGITEGIGTQSTNINPEEPFQEINNHIFSLHNHFFFKNSKLDIDLGYIYNDRNEFEEHEDEEEHDDNESAALQLKLKTFNYNAKYHLPKFKNGVEAIIGLQGMLQTNKNLGEELLIPNARINDIGLFTTINYQWDTSSIQTGIRFDARDLKTEKQVIVDGNDTRVFNALQKNYTSFTVSLGYKFTLFKNTTVRINTATGFRAPNLAELTSNGVHEGTNRYEVGNSNLNTEKNIQLDLSLEYKTDHIELFGNGFYNQLNDYIFLAPTGTIKNNAPVYNYTQQNAKLYGGEFGFHLHPHPIDWLHLESSFEMVIGKQQSGAHLPLIPSNVFKNTLRTEFNIKNWFQNGYTTLSLNSNLKQNKIGQFETATPAYNLINFGFGGDVTFKTLKFNTSLSINNILNTKYINHLSRLKADNILNAGRNIVFGLSFKI